MNRAGLTAFLTLSAIVPAQAHHVMDGAMPVTAWQGLLSGLGHPIIGIDHLVAVVAVAALAAGFRSAVPLAVGYVVAMMLGATAHVQGVDLPAGEIVVGLSVVALGAALFTRAAMPASAALALFIVAGFVHGHALGETIVGAERAPLGAYFIGLAVIQSALALGVIALTRWATERRAGAANLGLRVAAAAVLAVGVIALMREFAA